MQIVFLMILALILIFSGAAIVFLAALLWSAVFTDVPYVPIKKKHLAEIAAALKLTEESRLYDLGCGDGRVLIACRESEPKAEYYGIEKNLIPALYAKFRLARIGNPKNVEIARGNFFESDISGATHVFAYLLPEVMDRLLPKFERELKKGARLVSCDYPFKNKKSVEVIDFTRPGRLGKRLYVYEF